MDAKSTWEVCCGDCLQLLPSLEAGSADLCVCDPPFNIGWEYDAYNDRLPPSDYIDWCGRWGKEVLRVLKPDGSFWLAIGDAFASDLDVLFRRQLGLHRRSWVVWHYTFGVNCRSKFTPSHAHLFHYVRDPKRFTFNRDAVKVPSARQLVYGDKRAKDGGRLPDDTWVLRPQWCEGGFQPEQDTWHVPRVCGTHEERVDHPCQMPLPILERIVCVSSNPGDLVLDPFAGSGTTLAAAYKHGRRSLGLELSPNYCDLIRQRMALAESQS